MWKDIKWLRFTKNINYGVMLYKDTLNVNKPFNTISLLGKGHARSNLLPPLTCPKPFPIFVKNKKWFDWATATYIYSISSFLSSSTSDSKTRDILSNYIVEDNSEYVINYIPNNLSQQKVLRNIT